MAKRNNGWSKQKQQRYINEGRGKGELLENQNKRVPNYLIYEVLEEHIVSQLRSFIDLTIQSNLDETYPPYIEYFLKSFQIHTYDYETID